MGGTLCGIMLAPCASVSGASGDLGGCIAAASYDHTTGEVHQRNSTFSSSPIDQNLEETLSNKAVKVTKEWKDDDKYLDYRPGSITVTITGKTSPEKPAKTITKDIDITVKKTDRKQTVTVNDLPRTDADGKEYTYTVEENTNDQKNQKLKNYTSSKLASEESNVNGVPTYFFTITNTFKTIDISGTKIWNDNNNQDGKRPSSITVKLLNNGKEIKSKIVSAEDGWNYKFEKLPENDTNGNKITYSVAEADVPGGYTSKVTGDAKTGFTITNTEDTTPPTPNPKPTNTTYTVYKVWDLGSGEKVPDSVPMQLYQNGVAYGSPVTVTKASGWTYTWTGLPQTENGKLNTWTVKEVDPDNQYTATVVNGTSSATVTNRSNSNAGDKPQDNHNKHNNSEHPNNQNNNKNNKPVHPSNHNKNNTTVHPGTPTIPKNTGKTAVHHGIAAGGTPRTGDQTSLGFWLAMLLAGAAGTAAALLFKRRNRKEEE